MVNDYLQIGGLQKLTLIDYPGKLAATVFLTGCNFRCPWCYSSELVLPEKIEVQPKISQKDFFDFLKERKGLLEGVVICGGEPTINKDLPQFIKKIKKLGYLVKLDTNGSNPKILKQLIDENSIDYVAMDIKAPKEKYGEIVGLQPTHRPPAFGRPLLECWNDRMLENIEKSIKILKNSDIGVEFRTTVVPLFNNKEDILKIAHWLKPAKRYFLQNFRPEKTIDPKFEKIKPYSLEYLLEICNAIAPFFETCRIR